MNINAINRIDFKCLMNKADSAENKISEWLEYYRDENKEDDIESLSEELRFSTMLEV